MKILKIKRALTENGTLVQFKTFNGRKLYIVDIECKTFWGKIKKIKASPISTARFIGNEYQFHIYVDDLGNILSDKICIQINRWCNMQIEAYEN